MFHQYREGLVKMAQIRIAELSVRIRAVSQVMQAVSLLDQTGPKTRGDTGSESPPGFADIMRCYRGFLRQNVALLNRELIQAYAA